MRITRRQFARSTIAAGAATKLAMNDFPVSAVETNWSIPSASLPANPATRQLLWCLKHINTGAVDLSEADLESHFTADFLVALPAADLLEIFASYFVPNAPMAVARVEGPVHDDYVQAILITPGQDWRVTLGVDPGLQNRINSLFFTPVAIPAAIRPALTKWTHIKSELEKVAPEISFQVSELVDGELVPLYGLESNLVLGIGSSFKLYVLAELARQIQGGTASWDEPLAIRDDLRSLPNGEMRLEAAGTLFPIRYYAEQMIAASDNTATDHLIIRLGRDMVEHAFTLFGNAEPERNVPLLLTREWFAIKLRLSKKEIDSYIKAGVDVKRALLSERVDPEALTLSELEEWPGSYFIDSIEWFASAADLNRVIATLHLLAAESDLAPISAAISWNPGIPFDARIWSYVGFKGGYETGVKSDVWLITRGDGRSFAMAAIINDPKQEINGTRLSQIMLSMTDLLARI